MNQKKSITRRDFVKSALAGLGGYMVLSNEKLNQASTELSKNAKIVTRTLGKTGIKLPVVNMGVMNSDNPALVKAALDAGIKLLDTAGNYQRGNNEKMVGSVIKNYPRDSYVIATKVLDRSRDRSTGTFTREATTVSFIQKFEESLFRLGLEYIDILYIHDVVTRSMVLHEPFMKALDQLKKDGKIRFAGVTTHWGEPEVIRAATESKFYDVVLTSYNFRQGHINAVKEAVAEAAQAGIGIIGMKTLAGGYLDERKTKPVDPKAAIRFVLNDEHVTTVIPGFTTFDQMTLDLSVMEDLKFTEKDRKALELGYNSSGGVYCQSCGTCIKQCPKHLPIPEIMRAHMYAYSYRNFWEAKDLFSSLQVDPSMCQDCSECMVKCVQGFDVKKKFSEIATLQALPDNFLV
jgi:predicted aldo/keto reductase-like oxidoreductase